MPLWVRLDGVRCVVVGGGQVAFRKIGALVKRGARVEVFAKAACPAVERMASDGLILLRLQAVQRQDLRGAGLVVVATDDADLNKRVYGWASRQGILCNVVDKPDLCSAIFPAVLKRGRLEVAVSTGGSSPAMAAWIRDHLGELIGPEYATAIEVLWRVRSYVQAMDLPEVTRLRVLRSLAGAELIKACSIGDARLLEEFLGKCLGRKVKLQELGLSGLIQTPGSCYRPRQGGSGN